MVLDSVGVATAVYLLALRLAEPEEAKSSAFEKSAAAGLVVEVTT